MWAELGVKEGENKTKRSDNTLDVFHDYAEKKIVNYGLNILQSCLSMIYDSPR